MSCDIGSGRRPPCGVAWWVGGGGQWALILLFSTALPALHSIPQQHLHFSGDDSDDKTTWLATWRRARDMSMAFQKDKTFAPRLARVQAGILLVFFCGIVFMGVLDMGMFCMAFCWFILTFLLWSILFVFL